MGRRPLMRLPWVSRTVAEMWEAQYDRSATLCAEVHFHNRDLLTALQRAEARYESLVTRMLDLKREGFVQTPIREPLKPAESTLAPETEFAIEEKAAGDPSLKRYLFKYAQRETAKGTDAGVIARAIRYGDDAEDEGLAD